MLYVYDGKVYVKPFDNKLVEVTVSKKGDNYNVEATKNKVEITQAIKEKMQTISVEEAYKIATRRKFSEDVKNN